MAKELPFFKFEPNEWENGNIQMYSREEKGLFIDLCAMYWSRLGDVPMKLAAQKLCAGNATAFDSLIDGNIFVVKEGYVCIDFLNEQLLGFENTSKQNSKNAFDGWEKRRKNKALSENDATALIPQCENDAIREDKIKEDKIIIKEDEFFDFEIIEYSFNDFWEMYPNKTGKKTALEKFNKLTKKQKETIEKHLPLFINYKPFKEYNYPNPTTYLNQERYNDEIQTTNNYQNGTAKQKSGINNSDELNWLATAARLNDPSI